MDESRRQFIHMVVWVWGGVVIGLPWLVMAGEWFLAYLILIGFVGSTIGAFAGRWWMRRRRRTGEADCRPGTRTSSR